MLVVFFSLLTAVCFIILYYFLKGYITNYSNKFWYSVEAVWLIMSLLGLMTGLYELDRALDQFSYKDKEIQIISEYQDVRNAISGKTMAFVIDSTTSETKRESIQWFYILKSLFENGYDSQPWRKFVFYTKAFVFEDIRYINFCQVDALTYDWPKNINLKGTDIEFKEDIREITNKLEHLENTIDQVRKTKPDEHPNPYFRYIIATLFSIVLPLKLLKAYADYLKSTRPQPKMLDTVKNS